MINAILAKAHGLEEPALLTFAEIGMVLCQLQSVEELLRLVTVTTTKQQIDNVWAALDKATMGRLIAELNRVHKIDPAFKKTLQQLVTDRNRFVHGAFLREEFQFMSGEKQRRNAARFLLRFGSVIHDVHSVIAPYVLTIFKTSGLVDTPSVIAGLTGHGTSAEEAREYFERLCVIERDPLNICIEE